MAKLTAKFVENLRPAAQRREISDHANGLFLISQPSGARSFAVRYRYASRSIKLTLGQWPAMTLADARKAAADAQHALARGANPAKAKADAKIRADAARANTLTAICESYLRREGGALRTLDQRVSILRRQIYPALGDKPIGDIKRSDLVALFDTIEDRSGPRSADVALAILRRIMRWHAIRDDEFITPIVPGMARQKPAEHRRTRVLDDDEMRAVWAATANDTAFSALVRFLLLSGARRGEAAGMTWDEVDDKGIWRLPARRSKTKTAVIRPLSKAALAVLASLPRISGCPFVFTVTSFAPIKQFSVPKARLDAASGVRGWTIHDLRRTSRSLMSRAHVDSDIAERVLGHSRGDLIERYDQHLPLDRMRDAVERLAAQVETIVNPPEGAVVQMRRR